MGFEPFLLLHVVQDTKIEIRKEITAKVIDVDIYIGATIFRTIRVNPGDYWYNYFNKELEERLALIQKNTILGTEKGGKLSV